jgi:hypothetical protein
MLGRMNASMRFMVWVTMPFGMLAVVWVTTAFCACAPNHSGAEIPDE